MSRRPHTRWRWTLWKDTATNVGNSEPKPGQTCRIAHRLVCPGVEAPDISEVLPWCEARRATNAERDRLADGRPWNTCLPETG